MRRWTLILGLLGVLALISGCITPGSALTPTERAVAAAARPILTMDPDANWTACYNNLVELGPASIAWLMDQPAMTRRTAPAALDTLLHTSLVRLLASPADAPPLSTTALETSLGVLHLDLKVAGQRLGTVILADPVAPPTWLDLYPAEFNHVLAANVNLEADRQALRTWWLAHRAHPDNAATTRRLRPMPEHLWRVLSRRYADGWQYQPEPRAILCSAPPRDPVLLQVNTYDYNLVRAACIWLGSTDEPTIRRHLIDLVGSPSSMVAYNARFALRYSHDERIQAVLRRFEQRADD